MFHSYVCSSKGGLKSVSYSFADQCKLKCCFEFYSGFKCKKCVIDSVLWAADKPFQSPVFSSRPLPLILQYLSDFSVTRIHVEQRAHEQRYALWYSRQEHIWPYTSSVQYGNTAGERMKHRQQRTCMKNIKSRNREIQRREIYVEWQLRKDGSQSRMI